MGIPHTLPGIIGFVIFSGFLLSTTLNQNNPTKGLQDDMMQSINQSMAGDQGLLGAVNLIPATWSALQLTFTYMATFMGYSGYLPSEFDILFILIGVLFVIAVVKFLRGVWDF